MSSVKARMAEIIQEQPEDATYEEIMRVLTFERMVERRGWRTPVPEGLFPTKRRLGGFEHGRNNLDGGIFRNVRISNSGFECLLQLMIVVRAMQD